MNKNKNKNKNLQVTSYINYYLQGVLKRDYGLVQSQETLNLKGKGYGT